MYLRNVLQFEYNIYYYIKYLEKTIAIKINKIFEISVHGLLL